MPIAAVRLNHAVLFVADLERAVDFYTRAFGMEIAAREPRAWQVDTIEQLEEARLTLVNLDAYTGESSHGATKSVYGADPDGNEFEIMWMLPREEWGAYENAAPVDALDLPGEVRRWSGVRTAGRIVAEAR